MIITALELCPCGSRRRYGECCQRLHARAAHALTAEELMRSRYSAFACEDALYLMDTWHPRTRPSIVTFNPDVEWTGLHVVTTTKGTKRDASGTVEFKAFFTMNGREREQHETSNFLRLDGQWFYVDGEMA